MKDKLLKIVRTLGVVPRLGYWNVGYVFYYRLSLKSGLRKRRFKLSEIEKGDLFTAMDTNHPFNDDLIKYKEDIFKKADNILKGEFIFYHFHKFKFEEIPDWFYDPFSDKTLNGKICNKHWTEINEFDLNTGDIKNLWEISRFDWVTDLARAYSLSNNKIYLKRLNLLLADWIEKNPINRGVNWRCGQETSIRIMKLFWASSMMNQTKKISDNLFDLIFEHLKRIEKNIQYAVAQDNNHGTSESAALYIGSCWLSAQNSSKSLENNKTLRRFRNKGRKILENRIKHLILEDGTFAQKSVNYHRVVIDTISFVLLGMREFQERPFNQKINDKLYNLGYWLLQMVSNDKGEVPNIGANDGAMFMTLHSKDYRDYRPALQLYFALLINQKIWDNNELDEPLLWSGINAKRLTAISNEDFPVTGFRDNEFVQIKNEDMILRVLSTQDNFRPDQAVMHIDLFYKDKNVIVGSGSFSYNSKESSYFNSIESHNCMQFANDEPMPKISRFLNGNWIKVKTNGIEENNETISWSGHYLDYRNNFHKRSVKMYKQRNMIEVLDEYESNNDNELKTLRFHLDQEYSKFLSFTCFDANDKKIESSLKNGWRSLYYMNKSEVDVMEFASDCKKGVFRTIINLK